jgi:hypothetical protein
MRFSRPTRCRWRWASSGSSLLSSSSRPGRICIAAPARCSSGGFGSRRTRSGTCGWHPIDHISSDWRDTSPSAHIGSTHVISERFGSDASPANLLAHFVDPAELFGAEAVDAARTAGLVSGIVCAHSGPAEAGADHRGRPVGVRLLHVARDTPWGMVLPTRFWMGAGLPREAAEQIPTEVGLALMQHAYTEFYYLSKFLPSLYIAENRERIPPVPAW